MCDSVSGPACRQLRDKWTSGTVLPHCTGCKTTTSRGREGPNTIGSTPPRGKKKEKERKGKTMLLKL